MAANYVSCSSNFKILVLSLSLLVNLSVSTFISDDIFGSQASVGRNLLQAKQACPVNFEFQNYTVITSQCKGPRYLPKPCCDSFKEFACPYTEELNDLSNNCASTMFSYINVYGKYPPGLFSSFCREGKDGLDCTEYFKEDSANDASGRHNIGNRFQLIMLTAACLVALFQML
ncbi:hypothetical protein DCAR_0520187 [Daucus carota subsp. sativus]|uniref:GPI-anchored protein LLG1-like domain-containing protein n=1 Tax=Daucus carota subsp. sativus TaxID=79200 RepID=A0A164YDM7_DAUCS|nr:PREDICTED: GPI-anchored protein LORELEI-like [Daucus carota subsp. sativus]XP_017252707.1 PREDICTED: GPI-anchored protein LORELEI-like [Daucus carota subsp. sativus]XP_017252708.1 PREDICTED: GPI-anchored protein LORELEI-like [Daucus carota subsp. sativus]WOH00812.1 hypothetical protein DCAR_0520187 [Daucus carota subsp. sativus]